MTGALYDSIGRTYAATRRADPRVEQRLWSAVGEGSTVLNIGAGAGSYEPPGTVVAVEPSATMIAQRPPGAAPAVRGAAEALPLRSQSVDVALGVLTIHHWGSLGAGIAELRRVARQRIVLLTWDVDFIARFWLMADYVPEAAATDRGMAVPMSALLDLLPGARVAPLPIPHDCTDGFGAAYWRRPERYLDPIVRDGISMFARTDPELTRPGLERLAADVSSGEWRRRYADLVDLDELDIGYRVVVADL